MKELSCSFDFWSATINFLNMSSSSELFSSPSGQATPPSKNATPPGPDLWEDRTLAGFVYLKANLSNMDTFCMLDVKKMTRKVNACSQGNPSPPPPSYVSA